MRSFFNRRSVQVIIAAILVVVLSGTTLAVSSGNSDVFGTVINAVTKPAKSGLYALAGVLEDIYGYMFSYDKIVEENAALREQVAKLEEDYREFTEISAENERLRALINLGTRHSEYEVATVSVVAWTSSSFSSTFTINKGSDNGIELYDSVVTELGYVVGQVTSLTENSATVTTLLDSSSSIGAMIYKTGATAVAQGDFSLLKDGKLKLNYITDGSDFVTGDTVVTSGKTGVFPRGLVIGYITDVTLSLSGIDMIATVEPAADLSNLNYCFVITDFTAAD